MGRCPICNNVSNVICINCMCGFCDDCIKQYTHEGCFKIMKKKRLKELKEGAK